MAEKRYYWLKLFDDFFTSKRIKRLRNLAGGDTYTIIYLKMQLKALKDEGYLYFDGVMDDFAEELALDIDEKPEDVKITIQYLLSVGLLETNNDEVYKLTYMDRLIGSETASAQRGQDYRAKLTDEQKAKERERARLGMAKLRAERQNVTNVTNELRTGYERVTNVDIEKEKEIDKEIEKDIDKKKTPKGVKEKSTDVDDLLDNSNLSDPVKICVREWVDYKKEQHRFNYKPIGFKKLLTEIQNQVQAIGSENVIRAMNLSMAKGYQGIIWDLVKDTKPRESAYMQAIKDRVNIVDTWT